MVEETIQETVVHEVLRREGLMMMVVRRRPINLPVYELPLLAVAPQQQQSSEAKCAELIDVERGHFLFHSANETEREEKPKCRD